MLSNNPNSAKITPIKETGPLVTKKTPDLVQFSPSVTVGDVLQESVEDLGQKVKLLHVDGQGTADDNLKMRTAYWAAFFGF